MFHEIIVVDYITDFKSLTPDDIFNLSKDLIDSQFLTNCPCGTIIGRPISGETHNQKKVYYPFFSHINMPIKAGERAWTFERKAHQVSYWMSRKVQNRAAEDLNFTHDDRAIMYPHINSDEELIIQNSKRFIDSNSSVVNLSKTRKEAFSRKEFVGEPVLFSQSKSIDLTLQGSNGTVINLTNNGAEKTATIELTAGLNVPDNQRIVTNTDMYNEAVKPSLVLSSSREDSSKLIISQKFNVDEYYQLPGDDAGNIPTISMKTDSIRLISKKDFKIIVGEDEAQSKILIKNDGNIVIEQGSSAGSTIKLSGENADQPYIRYDELRSVITEIESSITNLQINIVAIAGIVDTLAGGTASSAITSQNVSISASLERIRIAMSQIASEKILGS